MRGAGNARWPALWAAVWIGLSVTPALAIQEEAEAESNGDGAVAEFPEGVDSLDRIVAVVGDTVVLLSDLTLTMFQLQAQGAQIPPENSPEWMPFASDVLTAMIDDLIFLQQAKRSGVTPNPETVDEAAEEYYQQRRVNFSSDEEMMIAVEGSGMNMLQYRQLLRSTAEAQAMRQQYRFDLERRDDLAPVIVSEEEIVAAFDEFSTTQPPRPALISFNQLVVTPSPSGEARDSAEARTLLVLNDLANGEDFAVLARRHSDDEGTREQGGELGWMSRDGAVRPFADAAWRARSGQTIGPIQTQYGLHFIKIERQRGAERFLRHILLRPIIQEDDLASARELAVEVADSLAAGVDPELLMGYFRGKVAEEDIRFDDIPISQIQARFSGDAVTALGNPTVGQVYGPVEWNRGGPTEYALLHVLAFRPEGPVELDDVRDAIRESLRTQKQIQIWLTEIREGTFIDVRL